MPGRLCGYCGAPLEAAPPALPVREVRRTVTLIFCDLKGSTALGERLDPEAMHEVKERYFTTMAAEITKHGGKIENVHRATAIMAVFGVAVAARRRRPACGARDSGHASGAARRERGRSLSPTCRDRLSNRTAVTGTLTVNARKRRRRPPWPTASAASQRAPVRRVRSTA